MHNTCCCPNNVLHTSFTPPQVADLSPVLPAPPPLEPTICTPPFAPHTSSLTPHHQTWSLLSPLIAPASSPCLIWPSDQATRWLHQQTQHTANHPYMQHFCCTPFHGYHITHFKHRACLAFVFSVFWIFLETQWKTLNEAVCLSALPPQICLSRLVCSNHQQSLNPEYFYPHYKVLILSVRRCLSSLVQHLERTLYRVCQWVTNYLPDRSAADRQNGFFVLRRKHKPVNRVTQAQTDMLYETLWDELKV